jgi:serine/threonine protein kinase
MIHGRPPFEADSTMSLMMMHLNDPVPDLRQVQPDAPEDLVRVIERCLAKNPAQRYQTAAEITAALKKVIADQQGVLAGGVTSGVVHVYSSTIRQGSPYQMDASGPVVTPQEAGPRPATGPIIAGVPAAAGLPPDSPAPSAAP